MTDLKSVARRAIGLLDLTNLNDVCTQADIDDLARRAATPYGNAAALCIWSQWVKHAKSSVAPGIRIATVANFPSGDGGAKRAALETAKALEDGADEVDIVLPYRAILQGAPQKASEVVAACRKAVPANRILKVIIEAGELKTRGHILLASNIALDGGADFIKTSTGKVAVNATLENAEIMLGAIRRGGFAAGFKAAGGIKTTQDAGDYLALADAMMGPDWVSPRTFRFGASGVLSDLLATLEGAKAKTSSGY